MTDIKEIRLIELSVASPIDILKATEFSGVNLGDYYRMLENFDDVTIKSLMKDMVTNYKNRDYK